MEGTVVEEKKECWFCYQKAIVRTGTYKKMGRKLRFVCETCRLTVCSPLRFKAAPIDSPP